MKVRDEIMQKTPGWREDMERRIEGAKTLNDIKPLWNDEIRLYASVMWGIFLGGATGVVTLISLRSKLVKLMGEADAGELLSNLHGAYDLKHGALGRA